METFTKPKTFVAHPRYGKERRKALGALDPRTIDEPIAKLIDGFTLVPHCFTLQSCYGHFVCSRGQNPRNLDRLPTKNCAIVKYRIAYLGLCVENSKPGRKFRDALAEIPAIAPDDIHFGSAEWFWKQHLNSYALQVEPKRYMGKDEADLEYTEALRIEHCRNVFFAKLEELLKAELSGLQAG